MPLTAPMTDGLAIGYLVHPPSTPGEATAAAILEFEHRLQLASAVGKVAARRRLKPFEPSTGCRHRPAPVANLLGAKLTAIGSQPWADYPCSDEAGYARQRDGRR